MEKMSADLCHFEGDPWLGLVDWYSNFTFAKNLGKTGGTDKVIKKLRKIFFTFGFAKCLKTDAGPEFRGRFQEWAEEAGITTSYSSAYNSSGNSRAEKAVQETKKLLRRVKDNKEDWLFTAVIRPYENPRALQGRTVFNRYLCIGRSNQKISKNMVVLFSNFASGRTIPT